MQFIGIIPPRIPCWPPSPPKGHLDWHTVPARQKINELSEYKILIAPTYNDPHTLFELCFCQTLHQIGVFDTPPKMKWWRSIINFFRSS